MPLRLAIFDLDGTLKQARDPYVYLHQRLGTWEACPGFFCPGNIRPAEVRRRGCGSTPRCGKGSAGPRWKGSSARTPICPVPRRRSGPCEQAGAQVALVSTGLNVHAELVQAELGVDRIFANEILFQDGQATGEARTRVPEGGKGQIVEQLQAELGLDPGDCLAVGDSRSDAAMFDRVRFGVAVNPACDPVARRPTW